MASQLREAILHQLVKHLLVDECSVEAREIVQWKVDFDDLAERPERLFFVQDYEKVAGDKVHALEVANFWVALHKGMQHAH